MNTLIIDLLITKRIIFYVRLQKRGKIPAIKLYYFFYHKLKAKIPHPLSPIISLGTIFTKALMKDFTPTLNT